MKDLSTYELKEICSLYITLMNELNKYSHLAHIKEVQDTIKKVDSIYYKADSNLIERYETVTD